MSWKKETIEIRKRRKLAKDQGGKEAIKLQHAKGRLTLRERIELLLDKGSFQEQGEIAGGSEVNEEGQLESLTPANFILGFGKINNKQVVVGGEDFTVKGGSPNPAGLRKSVYTEELALKYKIPLIRLHEGGGGSVAGPGKKSGGRRQCHADDGRTPKSGSGSPYECPTNAPASTGPGCFLCACTVHVDLLPRHTASRIDVT